MTTTENLISNISYTNKDFQAIYPALLDLVKKITYRWDPSISNESDPGVILLKLNALIGDKCNYNIDKNVLECFPLSVTQDRNARQLYAQLGYYMHWRLGATTSVTMKWVGTTSSGSVTIPKFTMVTDSDNSVVYTLIDEVALPLDGTYVQVDAIQGIAINYTLNGSSLITTEDLDSNNRLYFENNDVAENGIFIRNSSALNYLDWKKVDNLLLEPVSSESRNYSFGVTQDTNVCYIEFPENAQALIGEGIYITFLKTDGEAGNIAPFTLEKFYTDLSANINGQLTLLTTDNVQIVNYYSASDGEDQESIDDAYIGYKHTVGTFNTLVTLRDYINAIINYPLVSNAFVCDRTNDIQVSYDVMSVSNGINQTKNIVEDDLMTPFDLKFYMLYAVDASDTVQNVEQFNSTFRLLDDLDITYGTNMVDDALNYISEQKHISSNYVTLLEKNRLIVGPNSSSYENGSEYKFADRVCLIKNRYPISGTIVPQYKLTPSQIKEITANVRAALLNALNASKIEFGQEIDYDYVYTTILNSDERIKSVILNDLTYETYAVYMRINSETEKPEFIEVRIDEVDENYSEISNSIRTEIIAKSILAGTTQLFVEDAEISPQLGQQWQEIDGEYGKVTNYIISALDKEFTPESQNSTVFTYEVAPNEALTLYAPNLIDITEYTSYVRYEYKLNSGDTVNANGSYQLKNGEYMAFYWTADMDSGYNYAVYGPGQIIKPSFTVGEGTYPGGEIGELPNVLGNLLAESDTKYIYGLTYTLPEGQSDVEEHIGKLSNAGAVLTTSKSVMIQSANQIELNHDDYYCSWILNQTSEDGQYVLFEDGQDYYRLKSGEYFLYTNAAKTSLVVLGVGTQLEKSGDWPEGRWACAPYEYSEILSEGISTLVNTPYALQRVPSDCGLTIVETQFITLNEGASIRLSKNDSTPPVVDSSQDLVLTSSDYYKIEYKSKTDSEYTEVPTVLVGNKYWNLNSKLNLNMSSSQPQVLTPGQSLTLLGGATSTEISTDNGALYVVSSVPIVTQGSTNGDMVNVSYQNSAGETEYPSIYCYDEADSTSDVSYSPDGETTVTLNLSGASEHTVTLALNFPLGDYVIELTHKSNNFIGSDNYLKVIYAANGSSAPLHAVGDDTLINFCEPKTHYIYLGVGSDSNQELRITYKKTSTETDTIIINKCYKYSMNDAFDSATQSSIMDVIKDLDSENSFDYTYVVNEDDAITNPLDSLSFFNPNHIWNQFTIGQLDTQSLDNIYISNKVRS